MDPVKTDRRRRRAATSLSPAAAGRSRGRPCACPSRSRCSTARRRVSLLEVSLSGARLEGAALPPVGKDVVLTCGSVEAFGTIAWAAGERCGVHFDDPIGIPELVALRRVAVAAEDAGMTPEEYEAVTDWQSGLAR